MPRLVALELENFQSLVEPTRIEFAPLTLLYGPNSAGKSAIFDALELLKSIWNPTPDNAEIQSMLRRWAHKSTNSEGNTAYKDARLTADFEFSPQDLNKLDDPERRDYVYGSNPPPLSDESAVYCLKELVRKVARLTVVFSCNPIYGHFSLASFALDIAGIPILACSLDVPAIGVPGLGSTSLEAYNSDLDRLLSLYFVEPFDSLLYNFSRPVNVSIDSAELFEEKFKSYELSGWLKDANGHLIAYGLVNVFDLTPRTVGIGNLDDLDKSIVTSARECLAFFGQQLFDVLDRSPTVVRADRTVPKPKDAQSVVYPDTGFVSADVYSNKYMPAPYLESVRPEVDPHYQYLAEIGYAHSIVERSQESTWEPLQKFVASLVAKSNTFARVNGYLLDHLFREKLYQITCRTLVLSPIDLHDRDLDEHVLSEPAIVRIYLKDGESRTLDITDVGSGIGFVLPVLSAISRDGVCQVQQPELHLHAELQGRMADVLIDRLHNNGSWQAIVETHSEHLLLRLLRRLRETTRGKEGASSLKLSDLAIYYFDPQVTGGTRVTRQAMTPLGDFYLGWPRGFFTDREKDLFDA